MPSDRHRRATDSQPQEKRWTPSRRHYLQALGLAGAAGLAGCQGGGGEGTATDTDDEGGFGTDRTSEETTEVDELPPVQGTYTSAVSSEFDSLNPLYNTEAGTGTVISYTIDGSYGFKPGQTQFPRQLELTSEDKKVWTASLRENMEWSDPYGEVTAEDWVYLITQVHQTEWSGTAASADFYKNDEPIPVEKQGKYEFTLELPEADPNFPKTPTMWGAQVAPKDLLKSYVDNEDAEGLKQDDELGQLSYTGNLGPYKLDNWERQNKISMVRNEDYYMRDLAGDAVKKQFEEAPYFENLEVEIIKEESSRLSALKTGEIDTASIPPKQAPNFKSRDDIYLNVSPQPYLTPIFYNFRANGWTPSRNQKVRQAFAMAVDKEKYVQSIYRGYADPAYTFQPQWSPWYDDSQVKKFGTGDLYGESPAKERMKEGLAEIDEDYGYDNGTLLNPDGNQVSLSIYFQGSQSTEVSTAEFLNQQFQENLGITLELESIGARTFVNDYWQTQVPDNPDQYEWSNGAYNGGPRDEVTSKEPWDLALVYGLNTYPMTPATSEIFFQKDGFYNPWGYYPNYDFGSLFEEAKTEPDREARQEIFGEIFGKLSRDQPFCFLSLGSDIIGYREGIRGPEEEFFNGWDFSTWHRSNE